MAKKGHGKKVKKGGSFGSWIKGAVNTVGNSIKNAHVLSSIASLIPHPAGELGAVGLRAVGLGKGGKPIRLNGYGKQSGGLNQLNGRLYLV